MKPVLLEWGKRPKGKGKHPPLLYLDPETREPVKYGKPLSEADFEGEGIWFIRGSNNLLVEAAKRWGVPLGEEYEQFLQVGLRVAQQLDGKFKDITWEKFNALYKGLEAFLLNGIPAVWKQRRDSGLESLLADTQGMSSDDVVRLSGYVTQLKQRPVPQKGIEERKSDSIFNFYEAGQRHDDNFVQNCLLVKPELRSAYVQTFEVAELHGRLPYSLHDNGDAEDIRKLVNDLGVESGKLYLKVLHGFMTHCGEKYEEALSKIQAAKQQLENARGFEARTQAHKNFEAIQRKTRIPEHPWQIYDGLNKSLGRLDAEGLVVYLSLISTTQDFGLWLEPDDISNIINDIEKKEVCQALRSVLETAVETLKKGRDAFFEVVEKHGVPNYIRNQAM